MIPLKAKFKKKKEREKENISPLEGKISWKSNQRDRKSELFIILDG